MRHPNGKRNDELSVRRQPISGLSSFAPVLTSIASDFSRKGIFGNLVFQNGLGAPQHAAAPNAKHDVNQLFSNKGNVIYIWISLLTDVLDMYNEVANIFLTDAPRPPSGISPCILCQRPLLKTR
jgi:hypothetical protein